MARELLNPGRVIRAPTMGLQGLPRRHPPCRSRSWAVVEVLAARSSPPMSARRSVKSSAEQPAV